MLRNSLFIEEGTEGPKFDPYGYTRITFTNLEGVKFVLKQSGLGTHIEMPNGKWIRDKDSGGEVNAVEYFANRVMKLDVKSFKRLVARKEQQLAEMYERDRYFYGHA